MSRSTRVRCSNSASRLRSLAICSGLREVPAGGFFSRSADSICASTDLLSQPRATLSLYTDPSGYLGARVGERGSLGLNGCSILLLNRTNFADERAQPCVPLACGGCRDTAYFGRGAFCRGATNYRCLARTDPRSG